jgi:predicted GH43/DUF377 family glycosyl hydrolase
MTLLKRSIANPVLKPNPFNAWEALNTFNAGMVYHNGLFHMLYRAQGTDYISHIGYAVSEDGLRWSRLDKPVLSPATEWEVRGVEDPRVTYLDGKFYMTYTAWSPLGIRASLAVSDNLITWKRVGVMLPDEDNKDVAIFPEKFDGRYCLMHRREPDMWLAFSDDLKHYTDHRKIMSPIPGGWEHYKIGLGGTPTRIDQGWLMIYHAVDAKNVYRLGVALLDGKDPSRVLARCPNPILEPEEIWEIKGDVPNVVFSCGHIVKDGTVYVYYGGADRLMALATCSLDDLLKALE